MDADGGDATEIIYSSSDAFVGVRAWGDGDILTVTDDFKVSALQSGCGPRTDVCDRAGDRLFGAEASG